MTRFSDLAHQQARLALPENELLQKKLFSIKKAVGISYKHQPDYQTGSRQSNSCFAETG